MTTNIPRFRFLSVLLAISLLAGRNLHAQSALASISGLVTDPQGAVLRNARVTATNTATRVSTSTLTNEVGAYSIPNLQIGAYTVTVELQGFHRQTESGIALTTGQALGLNIQLQIGAVTETVNVVDEAPPLNTRSSEIGQLIGTKSVSELPLGNRDTMNILRLTGAAVFVDSANVSLAGGRTKSANTWLDGGSGQNMRLGISTVEFDPPADTVQELQVLTNNASAEFGGTASGSLVISTKSGTNQYHGTLYEFVRNNAFDAPGFFAPIQNGSKVSPELRYNIFGGTVGGPIRRDKTFFFFGYEGQRQRVGSSTTLTVPTPLQRTGDFSQTFNAAGQLIKIYDPKTTQLVNGVNVRSMFPGNVIPTSSLDPVALKVMNFYPSPNRAPDNLSGANNFRANSVTGTVSNYYVARVDHNFSERDRLTGRFIHTDGNTNNNSVYPDPGADPFLGTQSHDNSTYAVWTHTFTPTLVDDLRFYYEQRYYHQFANGVDGDYLSKLGLTGITANAFPLFSPAGFSPLGSSSQERRQYPVAQTQVVDNLSWVLGKHSLKFGFEVRRSNDDEINLSTAAGAFTFGTQPTGQPGSASTGNGLASLLIGFPTAFNEASTPAVSRYSWYYAGFIQDDFTVTSRLTLNFGLRWETDTPMKDYNNIMNGFDPNQINPVSGTPGVVKFMGVNGYTTSPYYLDLNNIAPRFGFAWRPTNSERTVIRGGFGVFFAHPFDSGQPASAALGFGKSVTLNTPDNGITAPFYLASGVPAVSQTNAPLDDSYGAVPVGKNPTTSVSYFDRGRRTGYSEQFNLSVQRQLPGSMILEIAGIGNLSHKLASANINIDQISPAILGPSHQSQADRPYPQFSGVTIVTPSFGDSRYLAGTVRLDKRFSHGLTLTSTYTYSKFLDNTEGSGSLLGQDNGAYSNYYNRRLDWGPSGNDIRHRFTFSTVYELPFGRDKRWLSHGPISYVVGNWTIGNVTTVQTGAPFTVITQTNTTNAFSAGSLRANVVGNPNLSSGDRTVAAWFDTEAFAQPAPFTFGNQSRNTLEGPGLVNLDFSLIRSIAFTESKALQIRGEFFNALNHTNLSMPASVYGAPGFGSITSAGAARQIQIGARLTF